MRIKIDEDLPPQIADTLKSLGHDVQTAHDEGIVGCTDSVIWQAAQDEERFLITQDLDFSDLRQFAPGTHRGILLIRLRQPGLFTLIKRIEELFTTEDVAGWEGCFVVATDRKVRVRQT
jgi:predicted nuclease of predicted toxin-antitoxin system